MRRRQLLLALAAQPDIRLGCQTRSFAPPSRDRARLLAILDRVRDAGFAGFETNYIGFESDFAEPAALRDELARRQLSLIGLHLGLKFTSPASPGFELVEKVARGVAAFQGSYVVVSGTAGPDPAAWKAKAAWVRQANRVCADHGVRLLLHNHVDEWRNDWAEYRALPDALFLLDVGHPARAGGDALAFLRDHLSRIPAIHVMDWQGETPMLPGTGGAKLAEIGELLRQARWRGWAILELEGGKMAGGSPEELVRQSVAFLRRTFQSRKAATPGG